MDIFLYTTIPANSILLLAEQDRSQYIQKLLPLPLKVREEMLSVETGAFIRGLSKSYDVDINSSPKIALAILFIAIGEKSFAQLPAILSTELKLPNDKAHKMAEEIEKDVFGPVRAELDEFLRKQKAQSGSMANKFSGAAPTPSNSPSGRGRVAYVPQNVLNLKELPARQVQKDFPVRTAPKPQFPLPPLRPPGFAGQAPKPANPPIRFT